MKQVMQISGAGGDVTQSEFDDHSARHENGGADEISVTGLSGLLADGQTPLSHNHTSTAGDGGVLTNDEHDGFLDITGISTPATPSAGHARLFGSTSQGHTILKLIDEDAMTLRLARDIVLLIRNTTGSALTPGQLVYLSGSSGNVPTVTLADADTVEAIATGMVREDIANNGFGMLIISGEVPGLNTTGLAEGTILYLSQTAGAYTSTAPSEPASKQRIGVVTREHATLGTIEVAFDFSSVQPRLHASSHDVGGTDELTYFAALAGRATGQVLNGGTAANDDLTLRPTTNATKGDIIIADTGGNVIIGGAATASRLRMLEPSGSGTNYTEFVAQAQGANITYTLPPDDGDSGEVLSTDGSGSLTWIAQSGGSGSVLEVQVFS